MEQHIASEGCVSAYPPIVTTRGQVLHNHDSSRRTAKGDLLLADVGAETPAGWAGDITRTWPVSGRWSPAQSEIYAVVLSAHAAAIATVKPGVRFRDVHLAAARAITRGLVDLDLLRGDPEELTAGGAHALFFPHGVGHLLGLDVHDMEDLGDAAGYPAGRTRAAQFGLHALRLDRELQAGMVVTIEPGFYQVPALLGDAEALGLPVTALNKETIARFPDVKGIRIEDDVLVTEQNCEILTEGLPRDLESVAALAARNT